MILSFLKSIFYKKNLEEKVSDLQKPINSPTPIEVEDLVDNSKNTYRSLRSCSDDLGISRYIIKKHIKSNEDYQGLKFRFLK